MSDYQGNIIIKNPATPTGPAATGRAPGMWKLSEVAYWIKQGVWPNPAIVPDQYFPYVSLLLSTSSLSNANNNLFVDSSGAFNPVSRIGNTTQGSFTPYSTNWSNYFDGSGDYLSVADNAALQFGTGNFTVECWVNSTVTTSTLYNTVIGKWGASFNTTGDWALRTRFSSNQVTFTLRYSGGWYDIQSGISINDGAWHHIAVVRDSSTTIKLYVDGTLRATQTISSSDIVGSSAAVGVAGTAFLGGQESAFTGYVSNARIVKGTAVYTANFTPSTTPLTAISGTSLLTCQSNRFRDASSNNFTVTRNGDTTVTDFGPFSPAYPGAVYNQSDITNWSGYFDGNGDYLTVPSSSAFNYGTGDFTIECWGYRGSPSNFWCAYSASGVSFTLFSYSGASSTIQVYSNGFYNSGINPGYNTWFHVAVTRSSGTLRIFINGVQGFSGSYTTDIPSHAVRIGSSVADEWGLGNVSNLRVVKGTALYTSNFTPPTTNLTAVSGTSLLTCQNAAFTDNSTNNFVITPTGNTTVTGNSPFNTVGYWSNYFDGSGDYLTAPSSTAFAIGTGDFTIEAWIFSSDTAFMLFATQSSGGIGFGYNVDNGSQGLWLGRIGIGASATSGVQLTYNQWNHIAVTRQSGSVKFFVNGTQSGSTQTVTTDFGTSAQAFYVGRDPALGALDFAGYASNARLVKGTAIYTSNFTVPTTPLTAVSGTSLLTCQNNRFIDNSSNAFTLTPFGNITVQSFDPFYTATIASNGGSMYFDGTGDYLRCPSNPAFNLGTSSYTVEFFIYTSSTTNQMVFDTIEPGISGGGSDRFFVYINTSQQVVVGPGTNTLTSSSAIQLGAWNHVAVVRSGTTRTIYINGVSAGSSTQSENLSSSFCTIGFDSAAGGTIIMNGYLSNLRVTKGTALYTSNFTPPTAPLTSSASTSLLTNGMNAGIYDATTINDMETVGNAQVRYFLGNYYAGSFDGSGDYLSTATSAAIAFGTSDFTFECWVNPTAYPNDCTLVYAGSTSTGNEISLQIRNGQVSSHLYISGSHSDVQFTDLPVTLNTWSHLAISRVSGVLYGFLNGVRSSVTTALTANFGSSAAAYVAVGDRFAGSLSNARMTKNVAIYSTATYTVPTSPLTATSNTAFLTCQNTTFVDNSPNALAITVNGGATAGVSGPFTYTRGNSMYFDGSGDYLSIPASQAAILAGSFTVEFWLNFSSIPSNFIILFAGTTANTQFFITTKSNGTGLRFGLTGVAEYATATQTWAAGTWYHVALVRNGTDVKFYVNGINVSDGTYTNSNTYSGILLIGGGVAGLPDLSGYMDDVRITNGIARYTSNFTPPTQPFPTY